MKKDWYSKQIEELYRMFIDLNKRIDKLEKRNKLYDETEKELRPILFELDNKK